MQTPTAASLKCAALHPRPAQGRLARKNSPSAAPPAAFPRINSPSAAPPVALPRKSSPSTPENANFEPFFVRWANYFALTHTSDRAGRTFSRTRRDNVATLKPTTPLRTPEQQPLKPASPLHPKNAPKTPISHPQRRRRFQSRLGQRPQRRHRFQTGPPGQQGQAAPPMGGGGTQSAHIRMQFPHAHFML